MGPKQTRPVAILQDSSLELVRPRAVQMLYVAPRACLSAFSPPSENGQ